MDDALLLRAQALAMMEGRRAEAIRAFQELIERFPESELQPHALFELGKLRAESGEPEKAIEVWVEALKRHPDPKVVQGSITLVRRRMVATTPAQIGERSNAFDRHLAPPTPVVARRARPAKTSVEAAGGSADEAARELGTPATEAAAPPPPSAPAPSAPSAPVVEE